MTEKLLPDIYLRFRDALPEIASVVDAVGGAADTAGPLDEREARLIKLGLAIRAGASGAVESNTRRGLAVADRDDIFHVAALAVSTVGLSASVAGYQCCLEVLDAE